MANNDGETMEELDDLATMMMAELSTITVKAEADRMQSLGSLYADVEKMAPVAAGATSSTTLPVQTYDHRYEQHLSYEQYEAQGFHAVEEPTYESASLESSSMASSYENMMMRHRTAAAGQPSSDPAAVERQAESSFKDTAIGSAIWQVVEGLDNLIALIWNSIVPGPTSLAEKDKPRADMMYLNSLVRVMGCGIIFGTVIVILAMGGGKGDGNVGENEAIVDDLFDPGAVFDPKSPYGYWDDKKRGTNLKSFPKVPAASKDFDPTPLRPAGARDCIRKKPSEDSLSFAPPTSMEELLVDPPKCVVWSMDEGGRLFDSESKKCLEVRTDVTRFRLTECDDDYPEMLFKEAGEILMVRARGLGGRGHLVRWVPDEWHVNTFNLRKRGDSMCFVGTKLRWPVTQEMPKGGACTKWHMDSKGRLVLTESQPHHVPKCLDTKIMEGNSEHLEHNPLMLKNLVHFPAKQGSLTLEMDKCSDQSPVFQKKGKDLFCKERSVSFEAFHEDELSSEDLDRNKNVETFMQLIAVDDKMLEARIRRDLAIFNGGAIAKAVETARQTVALPQSRNYSMHMGYLSAEGELLKGQMTVEEAKLKCNSLPECVGFTFEGGARDASDVVEIYFKNHQIVNLDWTIYDKEASDYKMRSGMLSDLTDKMVMNTTIDQAKKLCTKDEECNSIAFEGEHSPGLLEIHFGSFELLPEHWTSYLRDVRADTLGCKQVVDLGACQWGESMKDLCPHACGAEGPEGLEDTDEECPSWAEAGECESNPDFMLNSCMKSCAKNAKASAGVPGDMYYEPGHEHEPASCQDWAKDGDCEANPEYMLHNCAVTCSMWRKVLITVTVDRTNGTDLGMTLKPDGKKRLKVVGIKGGLIGRYNSHSKGHPVRVGDHIVQVNGAWSDASDIWHSLERKTILEITVQQYAHRDAGKSPQQVKEVLEVIKAKQEARREKHLGQNASRSEFDRHANMLKEMLQDAVHKHHVDNPSIVGGFRKGDRIMVIKEIKIHNQTVVRQGTKGYVVGPSWNHPGEKLEIQVDERLDDSNHTLNVKANRIRLLESGGSAELERELNAVRDKLKEREEMFEMLQQKQKQQALDNLGDTEIKRQQQAVALKIEIDELELRKKEHQLELDLANKKRQDAYDELHAAVKKKTDAHDAYRDLHFGNISEAKLLNLEKDRWEQEKEEAEREKREKEEQELLELTGNNTQLHAEIKQATEMLKNKRAAIAYEKKEAARLQHLAKMIHLEDKVSEREAQRLAAHRRQREEHADEYEREKEEEEKKRKFLEEAKAFMDGGKVAKPPSGPAQPPAAPPASAVNKGFNAPGAPAAKKPAPPSAARPPAPASPAAGKGGTRTQDVLPKGLGAQFFDPTAVKVARPGGAPKAPGGAPSGSRAEKTAWSGASPGGAPGGAPGKARPAVKDFGGFGASPGRAPGAAPSPAGGAPGAPDSSGAPSPSAFMGRR
jgi:hypothetical protein